MNYFSDCSNCKYSDTCGSNYCDAARTRVYNISRGYDCWEPKYIPMSQLKRGNVFIHNGYVSVAIDDANDELVWTTRIEYYNDDGIYGYTSASIENTDNTQVQFIAFDKCLL